MLVEDGVDTLGGVNIRYLKSILIDEAHVSSAIATIFCPLLGGGWWRSKVPCSDWPDCGGKAWSNQVQSLSVPVIDSTYSCKRASVVKSSGPNL